MAISRCSFSTSVVVFCLAYGSVVSAALAAEPVNAASGFAAPLHTAIDADGRISFSRKLDQSIVARQRMMRSVEVPSASLSEDSSDAVGNQSEAFLPGLFVGSATYIVKVADKDLFLHAWGGSKEGAAIKLHGDKSYASARANSKFHISKIPNGFYIVCVSDKNLCLHSVHGDKPIELKGDSTFAMKDPNSQFRISVVHGTLPPTFVIKLARSNLHFNVKSGSHDGNALYARGTYVHAKNHVTSQFLFYRVGNLPQSMIMSTKNEEMPAEKQANRRRAKVAALLARNVYKVKKCPDDWHKEAEKIWTGDGGKDHLLLCSIGGGDTKECMIAFSGTDDLKDVISDMDATIHKVAVRRRRRRGAPPLPSEESEPLAYAETTANELQIHKGFYKEFEHLVHKAVLDPTWPENSADRIKAKYKCQQLHVTGHSLGGAIADLYTMWYYHFVDSVYTFAAPMPYHGNPGAPCKHNAYRYAILHDPIAQLPGQVAGWFHGPMNRRLFKCCLKIGAPDPKHMDRRDSTCQQDKFGMYDAFGGGCVSGVCATNPHGIKLYEDMVNHFED